MGLNCCVGFVVLAGGLLVGCGDPNVPAERPSPATKPAPTAEQSPAEILRESAQVYRNTEYLRMRVEMARHLKKSWVIFSTEREVEKLVAEALHGPQARVRLDVFRDGKRILELRSRIHDGKVVVQERTGNSSILEYRLDPLERPNGTWDVESDVGFKSCLVGAVICSTAGPQSMFADFLEELSSETIQKEETEEVNGVMCQVVRCERARSGRKIIDRFWVAVDSHLVMKWHTKVGGAHNTKSYIYLPVADPGLDQFRFPD